MYNDLFDTYLMMLSNYQQCLKSGCHSCIRQEKKSQAYQKIAWGKSIDFSSNPKINNGFSLDIFLAVKQSLTSAGYNLKEKISCHLSSKNGKPYTFTIKRLQLVAHQHLRRTQSLNDLNQDLFDNKVNLQKSFL